MEHRAELRLDPCPHPCRDAGCPLEDKDALWSSRVSLGEVQAPCFVAG